MPPPSSRSCTVDDAFAEAVSPGDGAIGTVEASRFAPGRKNAFSWEVNGSRGSIALDLERLTELKISEGGKGFTTKLVSEADDPFWSWWRPHRRMIGWEHTFVHELEHPLGAIAGRNAVPPHGATLEDGYRAAEVDAVGRERPPHPRRIPLRATRRASRDRRRTRLGLRSWPSRARA